jgi:putative flippase GtrA
MKPALSVVLPCYNEGPNIPLIIDRLKPFWPQENFELILVNNGSTDDSAEILTAETAKPGNEFVRVVTVPQNIGYGHGILTGLKAAQAPILAYSHADIQTPPEDVFKAYHLLIDGDLEQEKTLVKGRRLNRPKAAMVLTNGLAAVANIILGQTLEDINGQPKLFSSSLLNHLTHPPTGFAFDTYLMYIANLNGLKEVNFPVDFGVRIHGESKWATTIFSRYKTIWRYFVSIINIARNHYNAPGNLIRQLARFIVTGILTNIVNYAVFWVLLRGFALNYVVASVIGFIAGFIVGFFVNRQWTFQATAGRGSSQLVRFLIVNLISLGANVVTISFFTEVINLIPEISQLLAIGVSAAVNFIGSKFWAFKRTA